jgi:hypothetical protein
LIQSNIQKLFLETFGSIFEKRGKDLIKAEVQKNPATGFKI